MPNECVLPPRSASEHSHTKPYGTVPAQFGGAPRVVPDRVRPVWWDAIMGWWP